jgi:hypothetical protein
MCSKEWMTNGSPKGELVAKEKENLLGMKGLNKGEKLKS